MRIPHTLIRWLGALSLAATSAVIVTACGGGGSAVSAANTTVITVGTGVANIINIPTVSVTVCAPGTSTCQIVGNVLVDTASYGLRLVSSAVSGVLGSLPVSTAGGTPLAECGQFVSSYTWGSLRTADLRIGGEVAASLPVQIIGDLGTTNVPATCTNGHASANSAQALGANGILGIGPAPYDCGTTCVTTMASSNYYACPNGNASCAQTTVGLSQQVANPVQRFAGDNNGIIVQMSQISASGQGSATGLLTFGIGTQSNNALGAATKLTSTTTGDVNGTFLGRNVTAFFDTGSNAYFFDDAFQTRCAGNAAFYCPAATTTYSATLTGQNNAQATVSMTVANATALFANTSAFAFNDVAGPLGINASLDVGLPQFYGKTIFFGMDLSASGGAGPYIAF
ncbi:Protein of unknown function DUF3443 [Burkholderia sp. lig30]|uniref:DUF3443 domain-containing protein n=1 Tax=Burkholderia sp. lig30 TaxID=1192124 RepID=UPI000461BE2E|nr:DUF3443 domain-containing protein [Burkholderia sp. lig30]KDB05855.1 Protein of unknown function DUF3443 [Burkholderia sp. lig30]